MLPESLSQHTQNQNSPTQPQLCCLEVGSPSCPPQGSFVQSWGGCERQEHPKVVTDPCYHQAVRTGLLAGWGMPVAAPPCCLLCPWQCC